MLSSSPFDEMTSEERALNAKYHDPHLISLVKLPSGDETNAQRLIVGKTT